MFLKAANLRYVSDREEVASVHCLKVCAHANYLVSEKYLKNSSQSVLPLNILTYVGLNAWCEN